MGRTWSVQVKRIVLETAAVLENDAKAYREFKVSRSTFYDWKKTFRESGSAGLIRRKPVAINQPKKIAPEVVEMIVELRKTYHLGPERITWYLERYHGIKTSCSSVYRTLVRQGLRQLPIGSDRRAVHTRRYSKEVPGHHVQVDVKFISLKTDAGKL